MLQSLPPQAREIEPAEAGLVQLAAPLRVTAGFRDKRGILPLIHQMYPSRSRGSNHHQAFRINARIDITCLIYPIQRQYLEQ